MHAGTKRPRPRIHVVVDGRVLDDRYHGIGRVTEALVRELAAQPELDLTLVVRPRQAGLRFDIDGLVDELSLAIAQFDHEISSKAQFLAWPRLLTGVGADVAFFPYSLGAAIFGRTPSLTVVHDCIFEEAARFAPSAKVRWMYRMATAAALKHNRVMTPSRASATAVQRHYGALVSEAHIVPWGVSPAFGAAPSPEIEIDTIAGLTVPQQYFLQVGARRPHKNVAVLVEAMAQRPVDEHLVLVGSIDHRFDDPVPALIARVGVADRVHHLEHVTEDELKTLYHRATAFLYPSLVEGVGLPLLEAMMVGIPVIASDIPVFREIGADTVRFAAPHDVGEWARAIGDIREDAALRADMSRRGREVARSATWSQTGSRVAAILQDVAGTKGGKRLTQEVSPSVSRSMHVANR